MSKQIHGRIPKRKKHEYSSSKNGFVIPLCNKCKQGYDPFAEHRCSDEHMNEYQRRKSVSKNNT